MLRQFIVYTTDCDSNDCALCIEDDSEHGACQQALLSFEYPEFVRIVAVKEVNVYEYPY